MPNYATKADLKNATSVGTSDFAKKTDLANLNSDVDKLDIEKLKNVPSSFNDLKNEVDKLETTPFDLSKLSDVVKNKVVKKTEYNELVKKVNNINATDTSDLVKETDYNITINEILKKITDQDLAKYITTQEFNKLSSKNLTARLVQANLPSKNDIAALVKMTDFDENIEKLATKAKLKKYKHMIQVLLLVKIIGQY